jgi:hypothetical protein
MLYRVATCCTVLQPDIAQVRHECFELFGAISWLKKNHNVTTLAEAVGLCAALFNKQVWFGPLLGLPQGCSHCAVLCSRLIPVQMWHVMSCVWPAHITARQWSAFQPALVEGRVCAIWHIAVGLTRYRLHHHARIRGRHCLGRYYFVERLDEAIPLHTPLCSSCSEICEYERHTHTRARTQKRTYTHIHKQKHAPTLTHAHRYECYKSSKMKDVQFTMCRRCYQQQLFPDDLMSGSLEFVRRLAPPCCGWQHNTE